MAQTYPRSVGGGGQPFINSNFKSPVRNTPTASVNSVKPEAVSKNPGKPTGYKYPRGSSDQVKKAFPKVAAALKSPSQIQPQKSISGAVKSAFENKQNSLKKYGR